MQFGMFRFEHRGERAEVPRAALVDDAHEQSGQRAKANRQCPNKPRIPSRGAMHNEERDAENRCRNPAPRHAPPQPRPAKRGFQPAELLLKTRFHHATTSTVLTRRASQPPSTISPKVTARTPASNQRQSFWRFSNSACCKCRFIACV